MGSWHKVTAGDPIKKEMEEPRKDIVIFSPLCYNLPVAATALTPPEESQPRKSEDSVHKDSVHKDSVPKQSMAGKHREWTGRQQTQNLAQ